MSRSESDSTVGGIEWTSDGSSSPDVSRRARFREIYEEKIYKPALVAWNDWRTRVGGTILLLYVAVGLGAVAGLYRRPETNQAPRYLKPFENMQFPLGSTNSGTDLAAIMIHSTDDILLMVLAGAVWATGLALVVGTVAGYKGGTVDWALTSFSDLMMSIPGLPLVIVLAFTFNPQNPIFIGVIININYWAGLGRSIRSQVLTIRQENYVEASRTLGTSTTRIIRKDIVPNLMPYVTVNFVFAARYVVFASVGLFFIGALPYNNANWGVTLDRAMESGALLNPNFAYWMLAPMLAIAGLALGLILFGQGMDRVFNPRVRTRMAGESVSETEDEEESTFATEVM